MNRAEVIARLKAIEPELRARGVEHLYLYGSYARDEARPDSDIDLLAEFSRTADQSIFGLMEPYTLLEEQFPGTEIGFGTREGIVPVYRPYIEQSAIPVF